MARRRAVGGWVGGLAPGGGAGGWGGRMPPRGFRGRFARSRGSAAAWARPC